MRDTSHVHDVKVNRKEYTLRGEGIYGQMVRDFSARIFDGTEPPVTIEDGRHSVKMVKAISRAVRERRVVAVREIQA